MDLEAVGLGGLIGEAPVLTPTAARTLEVWRLLGGYEIQRLPIVDMVCPVDDVDALLDGLMIVRDTLNEARPNES